MTAFARDVRADIGVPLMSRLKDSTRAQHEALHKVGALSLLLQPVLEPVAYRAILDRFDAFLAMVERDLLTAAADDWLEDAGFRRASRRPDLTQDLADLTAAGVMSPKELVDLIPAPRGPGGPGALLGVLYVIEGSRLGGQGLARRARQALPSSLSHATRFFGSPGVDVAAYWQRVGATINALGADPMVGEEACRAAQGAFLLLSDLFDEVP